MNTIRALGQVLLCWLDREGLTPFFLFWMVTFKIYFILHSSVDKYLVASYIIFEGKRMRDKEEKGIKK
jgi:hypothetical protein